MNENPFASAFENGVISAPGEHNQPVLSVSELSGALKRTVEDAFSLVRVRGEISGFKRAASGHMYLALKDDSAVMDAVVWKGVASKLALSHPQDGMEVVCKGRLTTFPGRSKYQLVIESMELAGEGALLKLLEDLKRKLGEEGLFDTARKKPIPYLPSVIGIVTSPTGAVIRDIMHRLNDRFPRHVLLAPVLVQGKGAAEQIAKAIADFNRIAPGGEVPRPDLIIVARGGGSLEDLWCFNEEIVVRAAAASEIPLISAVGHETDTTLIDYASDRRAPTPTAAAEMAVPVRLDLLAQVKDDGTRLLSAMTRMLDERSVRVDALARGLPNPVRTVEEMEQRLDDRIERLANATQVMFVQYQAKIAHLGASLPHPRQQLENARERLEARSRSLVTSYQSFTHGKERGFERVATLLRPKIVQDGIDRSTQKLARLSDLLESYSYKSVLERGFALVTDRNGQPIVGSNGLVAGDGLSVHFAKDDILEVVVAKDGEAVTDPSMRASGPVKPKAKSKRNVAETDKPKQGSLF